MKKHISVLFDESIEGLNIKENGIYVDCTLGYAGHSSEILKKVKKGKLFAFDQDINAVTYSNELLSKIGSNFKIINSNFANIDVELQKLNINKVDGILYDLGVSSPQLDVKERGFSYQQDARLDMRMDINSELDAHYIINNYKYEDLVKIFFEYGEEEFSRSIAKSIVKIREEKVINTTQELVEIIKNNVSEKRKRKSHPAKKVFQALRIEVNNEFEVLKASLHKSIKLLNSGGRMCVITFHSKEDKIVKNIFKEYSDIDKRVRGLPIIPDQYKPIIKLVNKSVIKPSLEEIENNNRSRSSVLRIIEKI